MTKSKFSQYVSFRFLSIFHHFGTDRRTEQATFPQTDQWTYRYARTHPFTMSYTEEPRNSAFQGTCGFYALLQEMPHCQYIELIEKASGD